MGVFLESRIWLRSQKGKMNTLASTRPYTQKQTYSHKNCKTVRKIIRDREKGKKSQFERIGENRTQNRSNDRKLDREID